MTSTTSVGLRGLEVVEFGHYIAGPLAGLMLADQDADMMHIDRPGGAALEVRTPTPCQPGEAADHARPQDADDLAIARRLVDRADVVIENFRPGVMDRLGLGPDALRRRIRA